MPLTTNGPLVQRKMVQMQGLQPTKMSRGGDPLNPVQDPATNTAPLNQPSTQNQGGGRMQGAPPPPVTAPPAPITSPTPTASVTPSATSTPASTATAFSDPGLQSQISDLQGKISSLSGLHLGTLGDIANQNIIGQMNDQLKKLQDQYNSEQNNNTALNTNYDTAENALKTSEGADVNEYNRISPLAQRKLIGQLNSRGLGSSLAAGGSGSGAYSELLNSQASGLGNIQSGYQGLQNNLEKQRASDAIDLDAFYSNLSNQRAYIRNLMSQNQAGFGDILGTVAGAAGLFI